MCLIAPALGVLWSIKTYSWGGGSALLSAEHVTEASCTYRRGLAERGEERLRWEITQSLLWLGMPMFRSAKLVIPTRV